jgi:hypothetical protein
VLFEDATNPALRIRAWNTKARGYVACCEEVALRKDPEGEACRGGIASGAHAQGPRVGLAKHMGRRTA